MTELNIFGVRVRIGFSFLLFAALTFYVRTAAEISGFFMVSLLHEAGHALVLRLCGVRVAVLDFCAAGVRMYPEKERLLPVKYEIPVLIAGPAANLAAFFLLRNVTAFSEPAMLSLGAALFNLLPYSMLDGGCILLAASEGTGRERPVKILLHLLRLAVCGVLFFAALCKDVRLLPLTLAAAFFFGYEL